MNRTKEWAARRRAEVFGIYDYATRYEIPLAPLPCCRPQITPLPHLPWVFLAVWVPSFVLLVRSRWSTD